MLLTDKPFGVNFIVAPQVLRHLDLRCVDIAARVARVVEFFYGEPDRALVEMAHGGGALVSWQVGSKKEAVAAADAGCDVIVVQGVEAGGHVRGTIDMMALLGEVIKLVDVPVLAAGGIGTGRAMAAALAAGADGVRVGTRFVVATEAAAHPEYVAALIASRANDTIYTTAFSRGFRDAPHRVLRSCVTAVEAFQGDTVGEITALDGTRMPAPRLLAFGVDKSAVGTVAAMCLFAGELVGAVTQVEPAEKFCGNSSMSAFVKAIGNVRFGLGRVRRRLAQASHDRPGSVQSQAAIAAISGLVPTMFMTVLGYRRGPRAPSQRLLLEAFW